MAVLDARYVLALDSGEHVYAEPRTAARPAEAIARLARGEPVDRRRFIFAARHALRCHHPRWAGWT